MSAALQIYSRDFDADFFKLPAQLQERIQSGIDRLGLNLDSYSHHRLTGVAAYRFRVGDYQIVYDCDRAKGILHLLAPSRGLSKMNREFSHNADELAELTPSGKPPRRSWRSWMRKCNF